MSDYPKDWKLESIGEIFNTITDYVAAGSFKDLSDNVKYYNSPNYAQLLRTRDIKSKFKNRGFIFINKQAYDYLWRVHFNDTKIIMPNIGNCGEVYFVEVDKLPHERCVLGPNAIMLFDTDNDMKFIYYALQRNDFQKDLKDIISPSGQTKFNKTDLSKINIRIPADIREQKAIADTLMTFDKHIENLEKLIEKKKMIRDGAVEELMTGKTRLDGFDGNWEEGLIIGYAYKKVSGSKVTAEEMQNLNKLNGSITIYAGGNTRVKVSENYSDKFNVINDEIVIIQSRGIIDFIYSEKPCTFKNEFWGYVSNGENDIKFLYYYLKYHINDFRLAGEGRSSFPQIKKEVTEKYNFPRIDIKEQEAIASILTSMDEEIENLEKEKAKIEKIKAGAMDDLLTGKVRLV